MGRMKKEIAVRSDNLPEYLTASEVKTDGTIGQNDLVLARTKICQDQSKVKDEIPGLESGQFYNSVSHEIYGTKISFFVACHFKSRIWFTDDFKMRGIEQQNIKLIESKNGNVTIKVDGVCHFGDEVADCVKKEYEEGKDCDNYLIVTEQDARQSAESRTMPNVSIFSCMSAARKASKQLNSKIMSNGLRGVPCFGQLICATTILEKFEKGKAFMPVFSYERYAEKNEFEMLKAFFPFGVRMIQRVESVAATSQDE